MAIANDNTDQQPDDGILEWVAEQYTAGVDIATIGGTLLTMAIKLCLDAGGTDESCTQDFDVALRRVREADQRSFH